MLPKYNIPTDMQAPFHPSAFSPARARLPVVSRTTAHTTGEQAIPQQLLRSSRLKVENQVTREVEEEEE
jgi:hypothetical protein